MRRSLFGSSMQRREAIEGYLWTSPWAIGLLVFTAQKYFVQGIVTTGLKG